MTRIPRLLSHAFFRVHIENGLSVALGIGLTWLFMGGLFGFQEGIAGVVGALCVSFSDQPDPLRRKPWVLGFGFLAACSFTALASFARFVPGGILAATLFAGLWTGLVTVYGKRALNLSMTGVLSFAFTLGEHFATPAAALARLELFVLGAALYTAYAGLFALLFDDRARRLLLAETMRAFADYLRAKAALYNPDAEGPSGFQDRKAHV